MYVCMYAYAFSLVCAYVSLNHFSCLITSVHSLGPEEPSSIFGQGVAQVQHEHTLKVLVIQLIIHTYMK